MSIEAMKQALEALENVRKYDTEDLYGLKDEITTLRQAIAEAEDAVAVEREACAKLCEELLPGNGSRTAAAIRARGEQ